jgi:hypothetical protein
MDTWFLRFVALAMLLTATASRVFAQHPTMPPGMTHEQHLAQMKKDAELRKRGAMAMGFDQEKTTHHFRLHEMGGASDFGKPFTTHGEEPPGVRTMQERRNALVFSYEDMPDGGRVRIVSSDAKATDAVHAFLRYQIREHATGDPLSVRE